MTVSIQPFPTLVKAVNEFYEFRKWGRSIPKSPVITDFVLRKLEELTKLKQKIPSEDECLRDDLDSTRFWLLGQIEKEECKLNKMIQARFHSQSNLRHLRNQAFCAFMKNEVQIGLDILAIFRSHFRDVYTYLSAEFEEEEKSRAENRPIPEPLRNYEDASDGSFLYSEMSTETDPLDLSVSDENRHSKIGSFTSDLDSLSSLESPVKDEGEIEEKISSDSAKSWALVLRLAREKIEKMSVELNASKYLEYSEFSRAVVGVRQRADSVQVRLIQAAVMDVAQCYAARGESVLVVHKIGSMAAERINESGYGILDALETVSNFSHSDGSSLYYVPNVSFHESNVSLILGWFSFFRDRARGQQKIYEALCIAESRCHNIVIFDEDLGSATNSCAVLKGFSSDVIQEVVCVSLEREKITRLERSLRDISFDAIYQSDSPQSLFSRAKVIEKANEYFFPKSKWPSQALNCEDYNRLFQICFATKREFILPSNVIAEAIADIAMLDAEGRLSKEAVFAQINEDNRGKQSWHIDGSVYGFGSKTKELKPHNKIADMLYSRLHFRGFSEQEALTVMCLLSQGAAKPMEKFLSQIVNCQFNKMGLGITLLSPSFNRKLKKPTLAFHLDVPLRLVRIEVIGYKLCDTEGNNHAIFNGWLEVLFDKSKPFNYGLGKAQFELDGPFLPLS